MGSGKGGREGGMEEGREGWGIEREGGMGSGDGGRDGEWRGWRVGSLHAAVYSFGQVILTT